MTYIPRFIFLRCRKQEADGMFHFIPPSLSTYPMRYTVYDMTPKTLKWEAKDVAAAPDVWELAKKNFLADKWWRGPDHPDTPEGNQKYIEFHERHSTMKGEVGFKAPAK
jgi:hypothetical protein